MNDVLTLANLGESLEELIISEREKNSSFVPGAAEWKCYQTIAQYLLADGSD
jgi:hypothetical protein